MKIEHGVSSLESSRRLKELGVVQESAFRWAVKGAYYCMDKKIDEGQPFLESSDHSLAWPYKIIASAFSVAELGEMLPCRIGFSADASNEKGYEFLNLDYGFTGGKGFFQAVFPERFDVYYRPWRCDGEFVKHFEFWEQAVTEADARAKMLIHLLETKTITLESVNERLKKG